MWHTSDAESPVPVCENPRPMVSGRRQRKQRNRAHPARRSRRRVVLWIAGTVIGLGAVLGLFAGLRLATVARDLNRAADLIEAGSANIEAGQLGQARVEFDEAQGLLTRANSGLYQNLALDVVGAFPGGRQNLRSLRSTVGLALRLTSGANRILAATRTLESETGSLEVPLRAGTVPLTDVVATQQAVASLAAELPGRGYEPSTSMLLPDVARAQELVFDAADERRPQLDAVGRGLQLLAAMSGEDGPQRFLIAVANPAEMRGGGGMILSYGVLEVDNGTFTLGEFGGIDDLAIDEPVDPDFLSVPLDYRARWEGREPTRLWRNTTLSPDLAFNAPIMEAMFAERTEEVLDGVIQIDPAGVAAILEGTGPVLVEGLGLVDSTNVVDLTINRAYIDFPDRDQRQELLGDVAEAAFDALVDGQFNSLRPLGEALFEAAQQRHISVFLNSFDAQAVAASFGATAELPAPEEVDHAILTVQNFSRNKLDYYLDTSLDLTGTRPAAAPGSMTATITVTNTAPTGVPSDYVFGPNAEGEVAGLYRGIVSLYLPNGATLVGSGGDPFSPPSITSEIGRTVVGFEVEVPAGESRQVVLELALAPRAAGPYDLTLTPAPRVRPTIVSASIDAGDEGRAVRDPAPLAVQEVVRATAN
jgi:hypothetical protein